MLGIVRRLGWLLVVVLAAGCLTLPLEKRTTHGPTAEEIWTARFGGSTGRPPSMDERGHWEDQIDRRISRYLHEHPEVANAYEVQTFRFSKQVTVGMTKEQVTVLLGAPNAMVTDAAEMEKLARKYWPEIKGKAKEVWLYPAGWRIFLADDRVIDITQFLQPRLSPI